MGGGYYDRAVQSAPRSYAKKSSAGAAAPVGPSYSKVAEKALSQNKQLHKMMDPSRWGTNKLECSHKNPIIFALDVTGSMGDWSKIIYDKMPMFYGQIMMKGYLDDPSISFCAIGDHTCDYAPLQIAQFGQGKEIDQIISKMYLEGGGGGGHIESYQLSAYFYLKHVTLKNTEVPFFFVTGDESYYPKITRETIKQIVGIQPSDAKYDSDDMWGQLMQKYNVLHLHKPYHNDKDDREILKQWENAIGKERVLKMKTPKACIDVMLGAIALTSGRRTLKQYVDDMKDRGQDNQRIQEVVAALSDYSNKVQTLALRLGAPKKFAKDGEEIKGEEQEEKKAAPVHDPGIDYVREFVLPELEKMESWKDNDEREELKKLKGHFTDKVPDDFLCPITQEIFSEPVMADDGNTYEKSAIQAWFLYHDTSPLTNLKLASKKILPNLTLKKLISQFKDENKIAPEAHKGDIV